MIELKIQRRLALLVSGVAVVAGAVFAGAPALADAAVPTSTNSIAPFTWSRVGTYDTYDECAYNGSTGVHRGEWKNYQCVHALKWELWVLY